MKKTYVAIAIAAVLTATLLCGVASAANMAGPALDGPAPNSGDGVPDGSGFGSPDNSGVGPAPNAGDGVPDGSGF